MRSPARSRATFFQRVPRGHEDHGQRGRFLKRQPARNAADIAAARQRLRGEAEDRETEDAIAGRDVLHACADGLDHAADFVAEDARVGRFAGIKRERLEDVAEVHARGFHVDQHFARAAEPAGRKARSAACRGDRARGIRGAAAPRDRATCCVVGRPRERRWA